MFGLIPEWDGISQGIEKILLAAGDTSYDGLYEYFHREKTGIIHLPAWYADLWQVVDDRYFTDHRDIFDKLGVAYDRHRDGWECRFTDSQARAYMLLHVFMHELGHHVDRMRSKNRNSTPRGEPFAERFATDRFYHLYPLYVDLFGL